MQDNHLIQTLAPDAPNESFHVRVLPGTPRSDAYFLYSKDVFKALRLQHPLRPLLQFLPASLCQAFGGPARQRAEAPRQEVGEHECLTLLKAFLHSASGLPSGSLR